MYVCCGNFVCKFHETETKFAERSISLTFSVGAKCLIVRWNIRWMWLLFFCFIGKKHARNPQLVMVSIFNQGLRQQKICREESGCQ